MSSRINIRREKRRSLSMRFIGEGIEVRIPRDLDPQSPQVQAFIADGLEKFETPKEYRGKINSLSIEDLHKRVDKWASEMDIKVNRIQIRKMRSKWASMSSHGNLTLAKDLLGLPVELVDYVIVHELLHLKIPEHGKGWQVMMGAYLADWRELEMKLAGWAFQEFSVDISEIIDICATANPAAR